MKPNDFSLRDLEYVIAIARYASFSQAAEACSVSQPALSKQIKNLEAMLGVRIFERSKRQVLVSREGQAFIKQAQTVLDEAEKLLQLPPQDSKPLSGEFRLGCIASSCPYLLPYFIGELTADFPELKLLIKEGLTHNLIDELKQGELDAVIAAATFDDSLLESASLFFEPFLLASSRRSQTASKPFIEIEDIDTDSLLLLEDGHCLKDQTVELCAMAGHASLNFKAASLETLLHMTAGGLGISIIPTLATPSSSKLSETLAFSAFANPAIGRDMKLYARKSYPRFGSIQALAQCIRHHLPSSVQAQ